MTHLSYLTENRLQYFMSPYLLKNIIEKPLCNCGEIEYPFHFFFECNQYNRNPRDMLTCISAICYHTLNSVLHGNEDLSEEQNFNIITTVYNFITKSKRFNLA